MMTFQIKRDQKIAFGSDILQCLKSSLKLNHIQRKYTSNISVKSKNEKYVLECYIFYQNLNQSRGKQGFQICIVIILKKRTTIIKIQIQNQYSKDNMILYQKLY